jgi:hypothetical protein
MNHFLAAVYQGIKLKRPDGTPYFNLRLGITAILLIHYAQVSVLAKFYFNIRLIPSSQLVFVFCLVAVGVLFMYLLKIIVPLDVLTKIEISRKIVKRCYVIFFFYFIFNIFLMGYLLLITRPVRTLPHTSLSWDTPVARE